MEDNTSGIATEPAASAGTTSEESMYKFFNETDFKMDWSNRRKVIKWTLTTIASLYSISHLAILIVYCIQIYRGVQSDPNVVFLLTTFIYTDTALATSVIMSYVFGANSDVKDFRNKMNSMVDTFVNQQRRQS